MNNIERGTAAPNHKRTGRTETRPNSKENVMALINCSECGGQVSDKAAACPHCGAPLATAVVATQTPPDSTAQPLAWQSPPLAGSDVHQGQQPYPVTPQGQGYGMPQANVPPAPYAGYGATGPTGAAPVPVVHRPPQAWKALLFGAGAITLIAGGSVAFGVLGERLNKPSDDEALRAVNEGLDAASAFAGKPRCYPTVVLDGVERRAASAADGAGCVVVAFHEESVPQTDHPACRQKMLPDLIVPEILPVMFGRALVCRKEGQWRWQHFMGVAE